MCTESLPHFVIVFLMLLAVARPVEFYVEFSPIFTNMRNFLDWLGASHCMPLERSGKYWGTREEQTANSVANLEICSMGFGVSET